MNFPTIKYKPAEKFEKEAHVKAEVKRIVKLYREAGYAMFYFMPVSNGMGVHGIPDFNFCINGYYLAIETKYGKNEPTPRQQLCLNEIGKAGGVWLVVNETNLDEFVAALNHLLRRVNV